MEVEQPKQEHPWQKHQKLFDWSTHGLCPGVIGPQSFSHSTNKY